MELKEKTPHTILNEIIEAAKECGQVMLQADRANFGIKDKAGKANFVTQSVLEKSFQCQITYQTACQKIYKNHLRNISLTYSESIFQTYSGIR